MVRQTGACLSVNVVSIIFAEKFAMTNSLDNIAYNEVVNTEGKSYAILRKELKPVYSRVYKDILRGYAFLLLILATDAIVIRLGYFETAIALPVSAVLIGYTLAYLHLFIHAAAHYDIHPDKYKNDQICDLFIGVFFGIPVKKYRKIHWLHHIHLGTKNDSEHSYFNELNIVFLLKSITGIHTLSVILSRAKTSEQQEGQKSLIYYSLYTLVFHATILSVLFIAGGILLVFTWLVALIILFPVFATVRQIMEHRDVQASGKVDYRHTDHGKVSRLFGDSLIDSSFGAAGFNKHLLHHWDPAISYTRLGEVESFLKNCPETAAIIRESKTSYLKTFIALFKL